jgi:hypothetical protein
MSRSIRFMKPTCDGSTFDGRRAVILALAGAMGSWA